MSRVALISDNSIVYIEKLINIWNNGDCAVLIDWRIPITTAIDMMHEADVKLCFIDKRYYYTDALIDIDDIEFIVFESKCNKAELLPKSISDSFKSNYSRDEAVIIYSSGTTGKSKGIILSFYAINTNADAIISYMKLTSDDCVYIAKTLSHSSTLTGELLTALKVNANIVISPVIVPPRLVIENVQKFSSNILCVNPALLRLLAVEQLRKNRYISLKVIYVSGSILDDNIYRMAHEAFKNIPIFNVYGLSELGPRVCAQTFSCCNSNSVGKPIDNVEIAVVNNDGKAVVGGEIGTVHVNSPSIFEGYVTGSIKYESQYQGWFNTGDVGYIDEYGELHITARIDDMIIIDSHKIYPSEVESIICEIEGVDECAISEIDTKYRKMIGCLYAGNQEECSTILDEARKKLASYEVPKVIVRCSELPKSTNGKLLRKEIKRLLKNMVNNNFLE